MSSSRDTSRDARRLASLYNDVAYEQLLALCWDVLGSCDLCYDNKIEIWAQRCQKPVASTSIFGPHHPESVRRTFVSINKCVAAIVYNIGWLAYCVENLDIEIKELTLTKPKRVHDVVFRYTPGDQLCPTNWDHTILLLKARSSDEWVVADASYAQYSFDNGVDTLDAYIEGKVQDDSGFSAETIGQHFEANEHNFALSFWDRKKTEAIVRTANNVMVRELTAAGGIEMLLDLSSELFQTARDKILEAMRREMEALRLLLEQVMFGGYALDGMDLANLVQDCDGAGHQLSMRSLDRERERSIQPSRSDESSTA